MNPVSMHLVLSHFPVAGSVIAFALLVAAWLRRDRSLWQANLTLWVLLAMVASASMTTGPMALDAVRDGLDDAAMEATRLHEVAGQLSTAALSLMAVLALYGWLALGPEGPRAGWITPALLVTSVIAVSACAWTGAIGGRIQHHELRSSLSAAIEAEPGSETGGADTGDTTSAFTESPLDSQQ